MTTTIFEALTAATRKRGDRPAVVFADAGTGERTELGFATLHNWVSKTANLLVDQLDVGLGSEVTLTGPTHWLVPVVCLATWATGAAVRLEPGGEVIVGHEADGGEADLLIGTGMGGRPTMDPQGALTVTDLLGQPDEFVDDPGDEGAWAIGGRTQATLLAEGADPITDARVMHAADRVGQDLVFLLARTLPVGVGLVIARGYDDAGLMALARQEGVG